MNDVTTVILVLLWAGIFIGLGILLIIEDINKTIKRCEEIFKWAEAEMKRNDEEKEGKEVVF